MKHSEGQCTVMHIHDFGRDAFWTQTIAIQDASPEYLDGRRGWSTMFNYCPYCGRKINWRMIRKLNKASK